MQRNREVDTAGALWARSIAAENGGKAWGLLLVRS